MIDAVLIDDERPALRMLEMLLKEYPDIRVSGMFTNPQEALNKIGEICPDVVFLDINMPQLQGIDAASRILDANPQTEIVFVTAYDRFAVEAFKLHALDYLLKPVARERLDNTVNRLRRLRSGGVKSTPTVESAVETTAETRRKPLQISCLGELQLRWPLREPLKWRAEKTRELFAYLLHHREGNNLSKEQILEDLWPNVDPERAVRQLYNGIYYIRKALQEYGVDKEVLTVDSDYHMELGPVDLDVNYFYEFEKGSWEYTCEGLESLVTRYRGDYLGEAYAWATIERERLSSLYLKCLTRLARMLMDQQLWERAEKYLREAYHKNPFEDESTELLLLLYLRQGNKAKAMQHLNAYAKLLREELGLEPEARLVKLIPQVVDLRSRICRSYQKL